MLWVLPECCYFDYSFIFYKYFILLLHYNDASNVYVTPRLYQVLSSMKVYGILFPII